MISNLQILHIFELKYYNIHLIIYQLQHCMIIIQFDKLLDNYYYSKIIKHFQLLIMIIDTAFVTLTILSESKNFELLISYLH